MDKTALLPSLAVNSSMMYDFIIWSNVKIAHPFVTMKNKQALPTLANNSKMLFMFYFHVLSCSKARLVSFETRMLQCTGCPKSSFLLFRAP